MMKLKLQPTAIVRDTANSEKYIQKLTLSVWFAHSQSFYSSFAGIQPLIQILSNFSLIVLQIFLLHNLFTTFVFDFYFGIELNTNRIATVTGKT